VRGQGLLDHIRVRRRRLERTAGERRHRENDGASHQPENGYSQLYQVYPRREILRNTMNGLSGYV